MVDVLRDLLLCVVLQLVNDVLLVRVPSFFYNRAEDLAFDVLLDLLLVISACDQPVEEGSVVAAQHKDEVEPTLGKEFAGVVVSD